MTTVRPFRALRYDPARRDLSRVIVPPYDVIGADERESFYQRDPHNAIRLELTRSQSDEAETDYAEVRETLESWQASGVLRRDDEAAFYVMRQRFTAPNGTMLEREGFYAELALEDYDRRIVRRHERTMDGPKRDRLKQLRAARANLSSVFLLYEDRDEALSTLVASAFKQSEALEARDDQGVEYAVAPLRESAAVAGIQDFLEQRPCVIADGHHRYETALLYRDECREQAGRIDPAAASESTLAYFANAYAPGSLLLPIHRVIIGARMPDLERWRTQLAGWQHRAVPLLGVDEIAGRLAKHLAPLGRQPAFAADAGDGELHLFWCTEPLSDTLMVDRLERDVIGGVFGIDVAAIRAGAVAFPKSAEQTAREVRTGNRGVGLYLNPIDPEDVFRITEAGDVMPQKSTFFYPKVPTGFVFRLHGDDA